VRAPGGAAPGDRRRRAARAGAGPGSRDPARRAPSRPDGPREVTLKTPKRVPEAAPGGFCRF